MYSSKIEKLNNISIFMTIQILHSRKSEIEKHQGMDANFQNSIQQRKYMVDISIKKVAKTFVPGNYSSCQLLFLV